MEEATLLAPVTTPNGVLRHLGHKLWEFEGHWAQEDVDAAGPGYTWVLGDNHARSGLGGQACIRRNPNTVGIRTKKSPRRTAQAYLTDEEFEQNKAWFNEDLGRIFAAYKQGQHIVLSTEPYGTGLAKLHEHAVFSWLWLMARMNSLRKFLSTGVAQKKVEAPIVVEEAKPVPEETMDAIKQLAEQNKCDLADPEKTVIFATRRKNQVMEGQMDMFGAAPETQAPSALTDG